MFRFLDKRRYSARNETGGVDMRLMRTLAKLFLALLILGGAFAAFWTGVIPPRLNPLRPIDLSDPGGIMRDFRLAALRKDPETCRAILKKPHIEAVAIPDQPLKNGCGWTNTFQLSGAGGARLGADRLTCEASAALALWLTHAIQPLAEQTFGQRVASVQTMGTYSCRNIVGNPFWKDLRSEHATANAIDIAGFTLADGRQISVLRHWKGPGAEAEFLRQAHRRGCRYFRVSLGPEFNASHKDHFHFDRGMLWTCE